MQVTVVNEAGIENAYLLTVMRAIARQIYYDFEPYWHLSARLRIAVNRRPLPRRPPQAECLRAINVTLGDAAVGAVEQLDPVAGGALIVLQTWSGRHREYGTLPYCYGFHDMDHRLRFPVGYVFTTDENDRPRTGAAHWSLTLSHEILELIANPHVNLLVRGRRPGPIRAPGGATPSGNRRAKKSSEFVYFQREVCDPIKESAYELDGVLLANFVLPLYFVENGDEIERVDFLGACDGTQKDLTSFGLLEQGYLPFLDPDTKRMETYRRAATDSYEFTASFPYAAHQHTA